MDNEQLPAFLRRRSGRLWFKFNINQYMRVKVTDPLLRQRLTQRPGLKIERGSWVLGQAWPLMHELGPYMDMGHNKFSTEIELEVPRE